MAAVLEALGECVRRGSRFASLVDAFMDVSTNPFTTFVRIEANGAVSDAFVVPRTLAARCFQQHHPKEAYLFQPPFAPFHMKWESRGK